MTDPKGISVSQSGSQPECDECGREGCTSTSPWNGHYANDGRHICHCGAPSHYQMLSGGTEFYCESCGMDGTYPEGEGGPRARLLNEGPDGIALLRAQMDQEIAGRKSEAALLEREV